MFRLSVFFAVLAATRAFRASLPVVRPTYVTTRTMETYVLLSDEETQVILSSAEDCAAGECSVDDVEELLVELKDQQRTMEVRLDTVMNVVARLQKATIGTNEREIKGNQVKGLVQDLSRVFQTDKPGFHTSGYAGDMGDGPTTAYEVLPPKKCKPDTKP